MIHCLGRVPTPDASRYLQRLCFHFSRKIAVRYDEHAGEARFDWGTCRLRTEGADLVFDCEAVDEAGLARVRFVIDEHVKLFSRKAPMAVAWENPRHGA